MMNAKDGARKVWIMFAAAAVLSMGCAAEQAEEEDSGDDSVPGEESVVSSTEEAITAEQVCTTGSGQYVARVYWRNNGDGTYSPLYYKIQSPFGTRYHNNLELHSMDGATVYSPDSLISYSNDTEARWNWLPSYMREVRMKLGHSWGGFKADSWKVIFDKPWDADPSCTVRY